MTQPRSASPRRTRTATPGVGITPAWTARPPPETMPSASASSSSGPDSRVSRPIRTRDPSPAHAAAAAPRSRASSAVRSTPATPRTPSVPNNVRTLGPLALRELRALAGLLQTRLLALDLAVVAGQEPLALQLGAQVLVDADQRTRDAVPQRAGLAGDAAAVDPGAHVVGRVGAGQLQGRRRDRAQRLAGEVLLDRLAVDRDGAGAGNEHDPRHRRLALAGAAVRDGGVCHYALSCRGSGFWAAWGWSGPGIGSASCREC